MICKAETDSIYYSQILDRYHTDSDDICNQTITLIINAWINYTNKGSANPNNNDVYLKHCLKMKMCFMVAWLGTYIDTVWVVIFEGLNFHGFES